MFRGFLWEIILTELSPLKLNPFFFFKRVSHFQKSKNASGQGGLRTFPKEQAIKRMSLRAKDALCGATVPIAPALMFALLGRRAHTSEAWQPWVLCRGSQVERVVF